ncbi:MAG: ABC transporter permease [Propionibacterium sp.]|nr:ABC transporter permease [Propionibacterium sp.]
MSRDSALRIAAGMLIAVAAMSLLAPVIAPASPIAVDMSLRNAPPSSAHWLGTDTLGRDVASRVIYGGRGALAISFGATLISMVIGIALGSLAGWFGKFTDTAIQVFMSIFQGLPGLTISIAIVGVMGASNLSISVAMVATGWSGISRVVRSQIRNLRNEQFVEAAKVYLPAPGYLIVRHLLPLTMPTLVVLATQRMGRMILMIASLSFIGVGLQPPTPDWGVMIQDGRQYFAQQPWALLGPAVMLFIASFSVARLGELLRDRWDTFSDDAMAVR